MRSIAIAKEGGEEQQQLCLQPEDTDPLDQQNEGGSASGEGEDE